jgi:hypothetical protein
MTRAARRANPHHPAAAVNSERVKDPNRPSGASTPPIPELADSGGQQGQGHGECRPRNLPSTGSSVIPSASAITSPWEARASMLPRMT